MTLPGFDDRDGLIWLNGSCVPWREARVHVLNHGLHYGSCVFDGERAYEGRTTELPIDGLIKRSKTRDN